MINVHRKEKAGTAVLTSNASYIYASASRGASLRGVLLLLFLLECAVEMRHDTTLGNRRVDNLTKLIVSTNCQEQMAGLQTAAFRVDLFGSVAGELQELCSEVLQQGSTVDSRRATAALLAEKTVLETHMNAPDGKMQASASGARDVGLLARLATCLTAKGLLALALAFALTLALGASLAFATCATRHDRCLIGSVASDRGWILITCSGHILRGFGKCVCGK